MTSPRSPRSWPRTSIEAATRHGPYRYLEHAGTAALMNSSHHEAIRHLSRALELLPALAPDRARTEREVALLLGLGPRGWPPAVTRRPRSVTRTLARSGAAGRTRGDPAAVPDAAGAVELPPRARRARHRAPPVRGAPAAGRAARTPRALVLRGRTLSWGRPSFIRARSPGLKSTSLRPRQAAQARRRRPTLACWHTGRGPRGISAPRTMGAPARRSPWLAVSASPTSWRSSSASRDSIGCSAGTRPP